MVVCADLSVLASAPINRVFNSGSLVVVSTTFFGKHCIVIQNNPPVISVAGYSSCRTFINRLVGFTIPFTIEYHCHLHLVCFVCLWSTSVVVCCLVLEQPTPLTASMTVGFLLSFPDFEFLLLIVYCLPLLDQNLCLFQGEVWYELQLLGERLILNSHYQSPVPGPQFPLPVCHKEDHSSEFNTHRFRWACIEQWFIAWQSLQLAGSVGWTVHVQKWHFYTLLKNPSYFCTTVSYFLLSSSVISVVERMSSVSSSIQYKNLLTW